MDKGRQRWNRHIGVLLLAALVAPGLHGQEIIRTYADLWTTPIIAAPLDTVDDLDRDGVRDMLLGDQNLEPLGQISILSGATGLLLFRQTIQDFTLGDTVVGLDDVTGDGVGDFMASGWVGGRGHVWSGATLERVWNGPRFDSGATIGDVDGDGINDYLQAGFGFVGSSGSAAVYYGGRHTLAYSLSAPGAVHYGYSATALGDVDGDGIGDFAVGAPGGFSDTICVPGEVYVHSGVDGDLLYRLEGEGVDSLFGEALASPGDVTGDGIGDLVVGARLCCTFECSQWGGGRISFFDGPKGKPLGHVLPDSFGGSGLTGLGARLLFIGDLDGNGYGDLLTNFSVGYGAQGRLTGTLIALDGFSREPIYRVWNPYAADCPAFGTQVAFGGDVNGDDFPDFFVSTACGRIGQPDDRVDLFSGAPIGVRSLGRPCAAPSFGRPPRIGATGVPEIGRDEVPYPVAGRGRPALERVARARDRDPAQQPATEVVTHPPEAALRCALDPISRVELSAG